VEPLPLLKKLVRAVRPGGSVAILAWSSETLLPGHPWLEARLQAASAGMAPFSPGSSPRHQFLRALGWFRQARLRQVMARTLVGDAHAPLSPALRRALVALFEMRWPDVETELAPRAASEFRRLCGPDSPDFILDHPDYHAFYTYSMFQRKVPGRR